MSLSRCVPATSSNPACPPTWLRTGVGDAPLAVACVLTLTPIVPAAVRAVGRFGSIVGAWELTFGPMVTLPICTTQRPARWPARFTDAMRRAVKTLLDVG